eukprot:TRINITY_DN24038_c0_g1_i1.p1 TRINITY_DN24038_c0_g1~~TRINITY_DN24038_c0_g1_i1.p1  ORF type:complete len:333 (+),score=63.82 TRINITY_DN24038_c0_g1_i1:155-1153(+)
MTLWPFQSVVCFSTPYERSFVAQRASTAYCLRILGLVGVVLFPLFLTFASDNVWVKESSYREQPSVKFAHDLLVVLAGDNAGSSAVGWCTRQDLRALLPPKVLVPTVRSSYLDSNHDGIADELRLSVEMPFPDASSGSTDASGVGYRQLFLMAVYKYELREKVAERQGGLVVLDLSAPSSLASGVWLRGRLRLRQSMPLRAGTASARSVYAENPLEVDWSSAFAAVNAPMTARAILDRYASRNETIYLEPTVPAVWDYSPRTSFRADIVLDVKPELIRFTPGALSILKFAWMQVLAFALPSWLVLRSIQAFAFENQIVETFVVPPVPASRAT